MKYQTVALITGCFVASLISLLAGSAAFADLAAVDAMNAKIAASSNDYIDYALGDVCVDSSDTIVQGDPAVCATHRNIRIGEKYPYMVTDFDRMDNNHTWQNAFNYPIPGTDGTLKVIIPKWNEGSYTPAWSMTPFSLANDSYDLYDLGSGYVNDIRTSDGGCYDQKIQGDSGRLNGWIMYKTDMGSASLVHGITITRMSPTVPSACGTYKSTSHGTSAIDVWNPPVAVSFETGKTLQSIVSYHYATTDLSTKNNALERFFFTREYGFTRWEAWMPLSRCQSDFASTPERCQLANSKNFLAGRCGATSPIAGTAIWGNQTWIRVDCRDLTNYIPLNTPIIPLINPATGAIPLGEEDGLRDVDTASVFAAAARGVVVPITKIAIPATPTPTPVPASTPTTVTSPPAPPTNAVTAGLPAGSYAASCSACTAAGNILACSCKSRSGVGTTSQLSYTDCQGDISNQNGTLTCAGASNAPLTACAGNSCPLPGGTYSLSCTSCYASSSQLTCACRAMNGKWSSSSLAYPQCTSGINNNNGKLVCDGVN